jgi:hypothetical protein
VVLFGKKNCCLFVLYPQGNAFTGPFFVPDPGGQNFEQDIFLMLEHFPALILQGGLFLSKSWKDFWHNSIM